MIRKHFKWFRDNIKEDRLDSTAAHGAYFLIISFLPFITFLLMMFNTLSDVNGVDFIKAAFDIFPDSVAQYLASFLTSPDPKTGIMSVSVITFLWSSSSGMVAIIKGFDSIYGVKETRNYLVLRLIGIVYIVVLAIVILISALTMVLGSSIYHALEAMELPGFLDKLLIILKSSKGFGFLLLVLFFTLMYNVIPKKRAKFKNNVAGAVFSAVGWLVFSYLFSFFVENFSDFSIYGSLATLIILMFWLFFCMYIMFLGAEVAMWLEYSDIREDIGIWIENRRQKKVLRKKIMQQKEINADEKNSGH